MSPHHPWDKVQRPWYAMQGPPWPAPTGNTNPASCQSPMAIMNPLGSPVPSCTHLSLYLWCTCPLPVHKSQLSWHLFGEASPGPCCACTHPRLDQEPLLRGPQPLEVWLHCHTALASLVDVSVCPTRLWALWGLGWAPQSTRDLHAEQGARHKVGSGKCLLSECLKYRRCSCGK